MENQKVENTNIFDSVVLESNSNTEANTVLFLQLLVVVHPVLEDDLKGNRLNQ